MIIESPLTIEEYPFDSSLSEKLSESKYAKQLWPIIYILSNGKSKLAYVGETTDALNRMKAHLKHEEKQKLTALHFVGSDVMNKSATLDIESNLIKYLSGDGRFRLLNGNVGIANHNYYQKAEYWSLFKEIWTGLLDHGIAKHSIEYIDNSDLFRYSPYKTLSTDQTAGLLKILESLLGVDTDSVIVNGGAGTGKSILAVYLCKLLVSLRDKDVHREFGEDTKEVFKKLEKLRAQYGKDGPKIGFVVAMSSFRKTIEKVFANVGGLSKKMVIGPSDVSKEKYDILFVDESHRLRKRKNLGAYFGSFDKACARLGLDKYSCSELDWVKKQSDKLILFYDKNQSIKPSDANQEDFEKIIHSDRSRLVQLKTQFRVKAGNDYSKFIRDLLEVNRKDLSESKTFESYDLKLFTNSNILIQAIREKDKEYGLCRLVAGYSWKWISKNDKSKNDILIEDVPLQWNSTNIDWVNSPNAVNEVGCIHTTQGYDLNYTGVIFGKEIGYDFETDQFIIHKEHYFDSNGKNGIQDIEELKAYILNIYQTILLRGIRGTYIYACDPQLRKYLGEYIPEY